MKKKIVFVSVPMSGKDDALIKRAIMVTEARYLNFTKQNARDVIFENNFERCQYMNFSDNKYPNLRYLAYALERMANIDECIFGEGWRNARGCRVEYKVCQEYGIPTYKFGKKYKLKTE